MLIDMRTIALILVISSFFQGIVIIFQSLVNKNYQGIRIFGISFYFCALGFLFILLQTIISCSFVTIVLGNSLLLLALIFQYVGLLRFLNLKEKTWLSNAVFFVAFLLLNYFNFIDDNITCRVFSLSISIALISLLTAFGLLKSRIASLLNSARFLSGIFFLVGAFSVLRAFSAFFFRPLTHALDPDILQMLSFAGIFILNFITTYAFIFMINKRLSSEFFEVTEFTWDVIWVYNITNRRFTYISPSMFQLRGFTPEEAMGETLEQFVVAGSLPAIRSTIKNDLECFIANPDNANSSLVEIQQPCKNGSIIWVELSTKYRYNPKGDIEIVGVSRNIEKRKRAEKEVLYLSYHDQLTGLYNRRFYEEELQRLDTERNLPIALIMADVNGLKLINDAYGHQAGDTILKSFADILKNECRNDEIVSRTGGDEFVILLPRTNAEDAEKIIERLYDSISKENIEHSILSVSMGFSVKHTVAEKITEVYKKAEDAMYAHKLAVSPNIKKATIDLIINLLYEKNKQEMFESGVVGDICAAIAKEMNFGPDAVNQIRIAGQRHDIGKIAIGDAILNKSDKLNTDEWSEVKRHPEIGYHILRSVSELSEAAKYVLEHHERWDGTGYPKGLKGEETSVPGRIIAIADAYSAMTSDRPFHNALSTEEAIAEIKRCSGTQFDGKIAKIFIEKVLKKKW